MELFVKLAAQYRKHTGLELLVTDVAGNLLVGGSALPGSSDDAPFVTARAQAIAEALRWGEPSVMCGPNDSALWAVPVLLNQQPLGGLVVTDVPLEQREDPGALDRTVLDACRYLQELALAHNLINRAELTERRARARREREKAEAFHELKSRCYDDLRTIYLREEPALLSAIRRGERAKARGVLNRVLTVLYGHGLGRMDLLKSLALELVVMMARVAVQAGGDPAKILGLNYHSLSALSGVHEQEELTRWLCDMLEHLIDAIRVNTRHPNSVLLARAIEFMQQNLATELTREEVARAAGLSSSHFSHLMREKTGWSFTELLTRLRVDHAAHLLANSSHSVGDIAAECGFADQSYFTRVFRKHTQQTPGEYRRAGQTAAAAPES